MMNKKLLTQNCDPYSAPPAAPADPWREAVLDRLAVLCMDAPQDEPPESILRRIIEAEVAIALDPRVSDSAPAAPAQPVPLPDERLQRAYALGWIAAASWAKHDDLIDDIGSPAYVSEMADALQACSGEQPVVREPLTTEQIMQIARKHGTVYTNRHYPESPAVAFSHVGLMAFLADLGIGGGNG